MSIQPKEEILNISHSFTILSENLNKFKGKMGEVHLHIFY